jgi:hypothetical protein
MMVYSDLDEAHAKVDSSRGELGEVGRMRPREGPVRRAAMVHSLSSSGVASVASEPAGNCARTVRDER